MRLLIALLVLLHLTHGAPLVDEEAVVLLEDSQVVGRAGVAVAAFPNLNDKLGEGSGKPYASGQGSGAGSGGRLKFPYHKHMAANKHAWAVRGGWSKKQEEALKAAKADHARAETYQKKKEHEKKIADLGCPCEGERYYNFVWKQTGAYGSGAYGSGAYGSGAYGSGAYGSGGNPDDDPRFGIKAMLKKYGKLGPNSSWTPMHEAKRKDAKSKLKVATLKAEAAFKIALPDFRRMQQHMPEFFTNGKCPCPSTWTVLDSIRLAGRKAKDAEADLSAHKRLLWGKASNNDPKDPNYIKGVNPIDAAIARGDKGAMSTATMPVTKRSATGRQIPTGVLAHGVRVPKRKARKNTYKINGKLPAVNLNDLGKKGKNGKSKSSK